MHITPRVPQRQTTTWYAKLPEERFESPDQMLASVSIPKQGLPARREVRTDLPTSLDGLLTGAGAGAAAGLGVGLTAAALGGIVLNAGTENMFGPIVGSLVTTAALSVIALPAGGVLGGLAGAVLAYKRGEIGVENTPGRLLHEAPSALFYPDAGGEPQNLGPYPR